ncbi:lipocalin family protein [Acinetobacter stercoris]|uniref:Outer membrane lipoprotein Blc n=1 Tax=Acinetobacter stercoris TaxID=2126983 RepID=A0A2U3N2M1_9GAMM|nr:lipocalin family protein [Acinetobacter stercoris]SPL71921.1 Outer membrane lipoprotein Blc precursor [Acinetobacter stercoris]
MRSNLKRIALFGGVILLSIATLTYADSNSVKTVQHVDLNKYLGTWYEIARKPLYFQKKCDYNVTATYSLNDNGNVKVDNRCFDKSGNLQQSIGEAFVKNAPSNSKLKVSFLPSVIRWLPVGRGDYWILKLDDNYETALVGSPNKKYLWLLSRTQTPDKELVEEYLNYAKELGYNLNDLIYTKQK